MEEYIIGYSLARQFRGRDIAILSVLQQLVEAYSF